MQMRILFDSPRATLMFVLTSCTFGVEFDSVFGRLGFHLGPLLLTIQTPYGMSEEEMKRLQISLDEEEK